MILKLHSFLKKTRLFSSREAERLILDGKIKVNGSVIIDPVFQVNVSNDKVSHLGDTLILKTDKDFYYVKMYKPKQVISSRNDPEGRRTVYDLLPEKLPFLAYAGRLDYNSEGLMVFSDDPEFITRLSGPATVVEKVYEVKIRGVLSEGLLFKLQKGVDIDGYVTKKCRIRVFKTGDGFSWSRWYLTEGKNRQIRRMGESVGLTVLKIKRVRIGSVKLARMNPGDVRKISSSELDPIKKNRLSTTVDVKVTPGERSARPRRRKGRSGKYDGPPTPKKKR